MCHIMGHLHQVPLSWSLSWSLPRSFISDSSFGIHKRIGKGKTPCQTLAGRRQLLEWDDAHEKSPKKAALATHFCSDILVDNSQQHLEALSMSTTLATALENLERLSQPVFSKKKHCRCYI